MKSFEESIRISPRILIPKVHLFITLLFSITSLQLLSQDDLDTSMAAIYAMSLEELLDTKVTIATKSDQKLSETPAIVSVITADDIRKMGLKSFEDILSLIPGFEFTQPQAGTKPFAIRGISSYNTGARMLVMIDGTPYNGVMYGSALFFGDNIDVDNIQRIEVIRGPGSALYGRNAFSAVVNIITKSANTNEGGNFGISYGSYNSYNIHGSYGISKEKYKAYFSAKKYYTDGTNEKIINGMGGEGPWNIYHDNLFLHSNIEIGTLSISGTYSGIIDGTSPGFLSSNSYCDQKIGLYKIEYSKPISKKINTKVKFYGRNEHRIQFIESAKPGLTMEIAPGITIGMLYPEGNYAIPVYNTYVYGSELEFEYNIAHNNNLLIGLQGDFHGVKNATIKANYDFNNYYPGGTLNLPLTYLENDTVIRYYTKDNMPSFKGSEGWILDGGHDYSNFAVLIQDVYYPHKNVGLTIGGRYDIDSEIGNVFNPRLGVVVGFLKKFNIKLLYGQAYRVPTCSEQYKLVGFDIGNKDLKHELIRTSEVSISVKERKYFAQAVFFYNYAKNLIVRNVDDKKYYNIGSNNSYGIGLEQKFYINQMISTFANYSYIISENVEKINGVSRTFDAPNMSENKFHVGVNYEIINKLNFNTYVRYQGPIVKFEKRNSITGEYEPVSQQTVGDVFLLNSTLQYTVLKTLNISLSAYNILNHEYYYQDTDNAVQPKQNGINFMVRINYSF
ncbi:MAG: TonB-dependent receptor [Bacteroidales bacterium]|nr:TonB-dependent receptor [Bacteroidales bacterium]